MAQSAGWGPSQRTERRGITGTTDVINRSKTSLLEAGDSQLFLREGDKQAEISLSSDNDKEDREGGRASTAQGRISGCGWQGKRCAVRSQMKCGQPSGARGTGRSCEG